MLKILVILILIGYVFYKVTSFLFSGFFKGFTRNQEFQGRQSQYRTSRKAPNSNVNIHSMPNGKSGKSKGYGGGEYVDYEEVK